MEPKVDQILNSDDGTNEIWRHTRRVGNRKVKDDRCLSPFFKYKQQEEQTATKHSWIFRKSVLNNSDIYQISRIQENPEGDSTVTGMSKVSLVKISGAVITREKTTK